LAGCTRFPLPFLSALAERNIAISGAGLLTRASSYSAAFPSTKFVDSGFLCLSSALTAPGEWLIIHHKNRRTTALPY